MELMNPEIEKSSMCVGNDLWPKLYLGLPPTIIKTNFILILNQQVRRYNNVKKNWLSLGILRVW